MNLFVPPPAMHTLTYTGVHPNTIK